MRLHDRNILLTGGVGFIGSHLAEALLNSGANVTIVDNLSSGRFENLGTLGSEVEFYEMDIRSPEFICLAVEGNFDVIFHLAANAYVPPSVDDPEFDFETNLRASFRLFDALRQSAKRPIIVATSSAAVYGNPLHIPVTEYEPTTPVSPYGVSKLGMERYLAVFSQLYRFRAASMRLFSVYGPRQHKQIVFDFIRKLSENAQKIEVIGDGTQVRDLIYVKDVARAALCIAENAPLRGEVYNVAAGAGYSTRQIAEVVSRAMHLTPELVYTGSVRPGDSEKWIASIDRISELGFIPMTSLEDGVCRTLAWYYHEHGVSPHVIAAN